MSDPKTTQTKVTLEVTPGAAAAGPEQPAEGGKKSAGLQIMELIINHPAGRKIAVAAVAAIVLLAAFAVHYAVRWVGEDKPRSEAAAHGGLNIGVSDEPGSLTTQIKVVIPGDRKREIEDGAGPIVSPPRIESPPVLQIPKPEPATVPPEPAKYLPNAAVDDDISLTHPDAVASKSEIATRGFNKFPPGSRAWLVRRLSAEARAYSDAIEVGWQKFQDLGYRGQLLLAGKNQFELFHARLLQAREKIQGSMSDAECLWVVEQLNTSVLFLNDLNKKALRVTPVTVPDFDERINPEWIAWQRKYADPKKRGSK